MLRSLFRSKRKRAFCSAVILAGGSGERMDGINKLFAPLCGRPVLAHSLLAFENSPDIGEIIIAARESELERVAALAEEYGIKKVRAVVAGGARRQDSAASGLSAVSKKAELIAIHDGGRPLVSAGVIAAAVAEAARSGAAAPAVPVKDTLKLVENGVVVSTPERSKYYAVQTPQVFDAGLIKAALAAAQRDGAELTDDCMAAERLGISVRITPGEYENIKITTPSDLTAAEALMAERSRA